MNSLKLLFFCFSLSGCARNSLSGSFYAALINSDSGAISRESFYFKKNGEFELSPGTNGISGIYYQHYPQLGKFGQGAYKISEDSIYLDFRKVNDWFWKIAIEKIPLDTFDAEYIIYKFQKSPLPYLLNENQKVQEPYFWLSESNGTKSLRGFRKTDYGFKVPKTTEKFFLSFGGYDSKVEIKNDSSSILKISMPPYQQVYSEKKSMRFSFKKENKKLIIIDGIPYGKFKLGRKLRKFDVRRMNESQRIRNSRKPY